ncbi:MAG: bifunctional UDP-N-acetylglucosamine diphosphorylase/glucosamine-1-phosphate N-acetyltransferase GlmU [Candidatus Babeliales bacterium]
MECRDNLEVIVLAAGQSTRFSGKVTKLVAPLAGLPLVMHPLRALEALHLPVTVVVGHQQDRVRCVIEKYCSIKETLSFICQEKPQGTGGALCAVKNKVSRDQILIINGDMPLITTELLVSMYEHHENHKADITFAGTYVQGVQGGSYGRVIFREDTVSIIESRYDEARDMALMLANAGIYLMQRSIFEEIVNALPWHSDVGEYYITDGIGYASTQGYNVSCFVMPFEVVMGVNTQKEYDAVSRHYYASRIAYFSSKGVLFEDSNDCLIEVDVIIGEKTEIGKGVIIRQGTVIGGEVKIEPYVILKQATINDGATVKAHSIIDRSSLLEGALVGPFAHIKEGSVVGRSSIVGNFVECTRTTIGEHSKIKHHAYVGDAVIGSYVNMGAGVKICNYNGMSKHLTYIGDKAFIGSNVSLVAPLSIGEGVVVGAGSTLTESVPAQSVAIARARQINKEQYAPVLWNTLKKREKCKP